jgi:hypothetical protein
LETWEMCYSSFTDDATSPAAFHRQCDMYARTVVAARSASGAVFGGYTSTSWGFQECCANSHNRCHATQTDSYCEELSDGALQSFLFGSPDGPQGSLMKFETVERGGVYPYTVCGEDRWPEFGRGDMILGRGGPPGTSAGSYGTGSSFDSDTTTCVGGEVYGAPGCDVYDLNNCGEADAAREGSSICGEDAADWGELDLEVWVLQGEHST